MDMEYMGKLHQENFSANEVYIGEFGLVRGTSYFRASTSEYHEL